MKLSGILSNETILRIERPNDKWSVIRSLTDAVERSAGGREIVDQLSASIYDEVEKREKIGSTGLGDGIAFPHARLDGLERPLIAFAVIPDGVDFESPDERPARFVFLFLFPAQRVELGVKIHASCGRFLMQPEIQQALLAAPDAGAIREVLSHNDPEIDAPVIALDLMRPKRFRIEKTTPLHEATQLMHRHRTLAAPVLDENDRVLGELNCNRIFERELPDYIKKLHSVPHVSDFKPFRKYFATNERAVVADYMNECDEAVLEEDASLLEIIFQLSVRKHPLLYVRRGERLIGVIDAVTVIDKVLNL